MITARERLRTATHELHEQVDALAGRWDLSQLEDYGEYLVCTARALLAVETALERGGVRNLFADWPMRARRTAIEGDLRFHGLQLDCRLGAAIPENDSDIFGAMYVLEGSRLGARALLTRIERSDRFGPRSLQFLQANDVSLWRGFLARLEHASLDLHRTTHAARETFGLFKSAYASTHA